MCAKPAKEPDSRQPRLAIDIDIREKAWRRRLNDPKTACGKALTAAWSRIDHADRGHEVSVVLADDAFQRALNKAYRGKDSSTNVLSFPAAEDDPPAPDGQTVTLGDIVLAYETVAHESETQGLPFADHFSHLLVHGMLHLMGYDHQTARDARRMETLEAEILADLGIGDPYADANASRLS